MVYAILLDDYQRRVAGDQYAVTFSGSLADCRALTFHDDAFESWPRRDYREASSEPTTLRDGNGVIQAGRIVGLSEVARAFTARRASTAASAPPAWPVAVALLGVALGAIVGYRRGRPRPPGS